MKKIIKKKQKKTNKQIKKNKKEQKKKEVQLQMIDQMEFQLYQEALVILILKIKALVASHILLKN